MQLLLLVACVVVCCGQTLQSAASELRILTYNIHHGRGADGVVDLGRIASVIRSAKPDLVALNEVDKGVARSGGIDQPAELARLTGMRAVFEKNIDYDGGEYGNAILTRFQVKQHRNVPLPSHYEGEQRGVLMIEVEQPEAASFWFAATHLDYRGAYDAERLESVETITQLAKAEHHFPHFVVAGDFNTKPGSKVVKRLSSNWQVLAAGPTYPASRPERCIDYICLRPADCWQVVESRVLDEAEASDHRPVVAVLRFKPPSERVASP